MAKKKAAKKPLRGGGGGAATVKVPKQRAAKKKPHAKTGDTAPLTQKGIGDVLEPRDDALEASLRRLIDAKTAIEDGNAEKDAAYEDIKALMGKKGLQNYRSHDYPTKMMKYKQRGAEVKIENVKPPKE